MRSIAILSMLCFGVTFQLLAQSNVNNSRFLMKEVQVTFGPYGHTLNATQVFSPDGLWVVYDTRNDDTQIVTTSKIEKVNLKSGEIVTLYTAKNQTPYGPGVGAAAWNPSRDEVIFIHGLENCTESKPYGFTKRFGAIVDALKPGEFRHAEARCTTYPLAVGALRGGTHAHSWSGEGTCISFTYNDDLLTNLEKNSNGAIKDLRTIGMSVPAQSVKMVNENAENFSGTYFSFVAATVTEDPKPESDQIDKAFDECWIGTNGYLKQNGGRQKRAIAFQGNVRDSKNQVVTEVFFSDVPERIEAMSNLPLQGTFETRPNVPAGLTQTRLTHTSDRKFPGLQGPRCRLRTSPDGSSVYFHMKDDAGFVQIYRIKTIGGDIDRVTDFKGSVQAQYNISPDGNKLSCISENSLWIVDLSTKKMNVISTPLAEPIIGGALWSPDGKQLVFNRYVGSGDKRYLQIFTVTIDR
ncbi:MAG: DUF3748 domain-containing protein [Chryseolinea sp.]